MRLTGALNVACAAAVCAVVLAAGVGRAPARADTDGTACVVDTSTGGVAGTTGVLVRGVCQPASAGPGSSGSAQPATRTVSCGLVSLDGMRWNTTQCGRSERACSRMTAGKLVAVATYATLIQDPVTKAWILQSVWCPAAATPGPDPAALRDQVLRLLPDVSIGTAPQGSSLVNIQTILWAATAARRSLGIVRIVGQTVRLRLDFDHAAWQFGDGQTQTTTSPGARYDAARHACRTALCPGYFGHTYTQPAPDTISLTVFWHATFSLDGSTWTAVDPAPLAGPSAASPITIREARAVLVPNPK